MVSIVVVELLLLNCCCFEMYHMFCCFSFCRLKSNTLGKSVHEYANDGGRFVTADARAMLENAGVILFIKDASAKKRGVNTSISSMEVSAASFLANEEVNVHDVRVPTSLSKDAPQFDKGKLT